MKLTAILLLSTCIMAADRTGAQTITLHEQHAPLETVLKQIQQQTDYRFIYTVDVIQKAKPVSISVKNSTLEQVLAQCFHNQPLDYSIIDRLVVIKEKVKSPNADGGNDTVMALPPPIDVSGRVVNENGEPVIVSVQVKGTGKGATTNENGEFELKGVDENATLVISGVSIETFEVKVNGRRELALTASLKIAALDETIIQAYGTTTRRFRVGSIDKISSEEISKQPVSNPLAALSGRIPGMIITQTNGLPGAAYQVEIRGRTSITPTISNDPLFIIDGVPFAANNNPINQLGSILSTGLSPFNSINPNDIESVEVLKDADATAIYGSRGANGVVLITTKKGKAGKTKVSMNISTGWSKVTRMMKFLNTEQYVQMRHEAFANDGIFPNATVGTPGYAPDLTIWDTTRYTDIQKLLHGGTARTHDAQVSLSGGNAHMQFLLGTGYHRETTVFPGSLSYERASFHSAFNYNSTDQKFNASLKTSYSADKNNLPTTNVGTYIMTLPPNVPEFYDSTGRLNWKKGGVTFENPLAYLQRRYTSQTDNLLANLQLSYKILPSLLIKSNFGYNKINVDEISITPIAAQNPAFNPTGSSQFGNNTLKSLIVEPQIEYRANLSRGKLTLLLGSTWQQNKQTGTYVRASGFTSDALLLSATSAPNVTVTINADNNNEYRYAALFGRLNYQWDSRYILNLTARRDGSSRFGPGKRYHNFGSVGAAWIFSEENFFKALQPVLSFGKLRGSYGTSGNDKIGDYMYLDSYSSIPGFTYQDISGLIPGRLYNSDYAWEVNKKLELALELGFWNNRVLLTTNYYNNKSGNQLINYILPSQTGGTGINANFPATVQNTGIEVDLRTVNVRSKDFQWRTELNLTIPKNKLVSFPGLASSSYFSRLAEGASLSIFGGYEVAGVNPQTGVFEFVNSEGNVVATPAKQDKQLNFGNHDPKYYGGLSNSFQYKKIGLDVFIEFRDQLGKDFFHAVYSTSLMPGRMFNQPVGVLDRWQKPGDATRIQRFTSRTTSAAASAQTAIRLNGVNWYYSDAGFVRIKNVSLYYNIVPRPGSRLKFENLKLYVNGQNLFVLTKFKGSDPETQELTRLPPLKTIVAGIQANF